jgi:uncharacterized membrane protein
VYAIADGDNRDMMQPLLAVHIAAGSIALASMLVPMIAPKGGRTHRRAGWVFVASMAVVSVTALIMSAARVLFDPRPDAKQFGGFLLVVALLTGAAVSAGVRVLRFKNRAGARPHWWDTGLPLALGAASVTLGVYGLWRHQTVFIAFGGLGLLNAAGTLRYWLRPPASPMHWWFEHMNGMLTGCVAATTAFLVIGGSRLGIWPIVAWLAPAAIGAPGIALWSAYYRRRFHSFQGTRLKAQGTSHNTTYNLQVRSCQTASPLLRHEATNADTKRKTVRFARATAVVRL